jgi:16S rRNA (cytosine967-C5)-methyltransferase
LSPEYTGSGKVRSDNGTPMQPARRSVPRKLALMVLTDVLANKKALDDSIEDHCSRSTGVTPADRAWLTEITSGVIRNLRRLDLAIDTYSLKKKPAGKIRKILQLAVYQLLHQDRVFPATVVSETVDFVRAEEGEPPSKFVNALLRKVSEARAEWRDPADPGPDAPIAEKAAWASVPDWWWKRLEKAYGYEDAVMIAHAALQRPDIWFRLKSEAGIPEFLEKGPTPFSARVREGAESGGIGKLPGFKEGQWIVQDLASQHLVDHFAGILKARGQSLKILDRCAAPGGKSVALSWLGVEVIAADASESRRKLLSEAVSRAAPSVRVVAENEIESAGPFTAVWVDAPCSGSGILRRHPDVRWLRNESDLAALAEIQSKLLREALALVPAGGLVFYSVCSLFAEEGRDQVRTLGPLVKIQEEIRLGPDQTPSRDGFYAAVLEKV